MKFYNKGPVLTAVGPIGSQKCVLITRNLLPKCSLFQGDAGVGLVCANTLVGTVSWEGRGCGNPAHPPVFVQLSYFLDWIQEKTGGAVGVGAKH